MSVAEKNETVFSPTPSQHPNMATRHVPLPSRTHASSRGAAPSAFSRSADFGRSAAGGGGGGGNVAADLSRSAEFARTSRPPTGGLPPRTSSATASSSLFAAAIEPASNVMPVKIRTAPSPVTRPAAQSTGGGGSAPASPAHVRMPSGGAASTAAGANAAAAAASLVSSTFRLHAVAGMGLVSTASAGGSVAPSAPTAQQTAARFAVHPSKNMCAYAVGTTIVLWDWNVDKHLFFQGHPDPVQQLRFSLDGRCV